MATVTLARHLARVAARKTKLGMVDTPAETEAMRNKGSRRTPEKRELLQRVAKRAKAAGKAPPPTYY